MGTWRPEAFVAAAVEMVCVAFTIRAAALSDRFTFPKMLTMQNGLPSLFPELFCLKKITSNKMNVGRHREDGMRCSLLSLKI